MADRKQIEASKIDALYSWLSYDMQKMKAELMNELKYSSAQFGSLYSEMKTDKEKSSQALAQEIRYSYKQNQTIYDELSKTLTEEVKARVEAIENLQATLEQLKNDSPKEINETLNNALDYSYKQNQAIYDELKMSLSEEVVTKLAEVDAKLAAMEELQQRLSDLVTLVESTDYSSIVEAVNETTVESISKQNETLIEEIKKIPVAENLDYERITNEVGDRVTDILNEVVPHEAAVDYDKITYGTAEKVIESLPHAEKVDYARINDVVSAALEKAMASLNVEAIAEAVAAKVQAPAVDYELLSDMVVAKLSAQQSAVDYERIAAIVEEKMNKEESSYELVLDDEGIEAIAESVSQRLCVVSEEIVEETPVEETVEEVVEETVEEVVEEVAEEVAEETVEEVAEEVVEETVEEVVEEVAVQDYATEEVAEVTQQALVEEIVEETPAAQEELAVAEEPTFDELNGELVDAETGLVIRLKKSFTAKIRQSEENVKGYYSDIKNELTSYKKINSNVSWHGDRFNFGRDTVAKINICGKTLCLYLALDPEDPDFKTTVYHQKNVGNQKAYTSTPFMVKVKSDAAAKKALRLVGSLAEKMGTSKKENFEAVDYVEEFTYASTKQLYDEGFIKVTKEKKVDLDF